MAHNRGVVRKILITLVIFVLAVVAILGTWIFLGHQLSLSLDGFRTLGIASVRIHVITYEGSGTGGWFTVNDVHLSLNDTKIAVSIGSTKDNQFALATGGKVFAFGPIVSTAENGGEHLAVVPQPQDQALLVTRRSILSWPTPFDFNFMTGHSPAWKRHMYYQVVWKKPSGATLDMLWRYEQSFYGKQLLPATGWDSGFAIHEGSTGLVRVDIKE